MTDALEEYGAEAAAAAQSLFEDILALEGLYVDAVPPDRVVSPEEVERIARYQAGKLMFDDFDGFVEQVAGSAAHLTRQVANRTMWAQGGYYRNRLVGVQVQGGRNRYVYAERPSNSTYEVRYARVPQGEETCDFCLMLASRGFVYLTYESADAHVHRNCDCIVVAGVGHHDKSVNTSMGDWVQDTQLEGFDRQSLLDIYSAWSQRDADDIEGRRDDMERIIGRRYWS